MPWNQDFAATTSRTGALLEELQNDPTVAGGPALDEVRYDPGADQTRIVWSVEPSQAEKDAAAAVVAAHSPTPEDSFQLVEATADTTTTSLTDVVADSMAITPEAGTYKVTFVGSVDHASNNGSIFLSIAKDAAKSAGSERRFRRGAGQGDVTAPFTCRAKVTVDGSEEIQGCWRTDGGTATMHERQLSIERVG